MGNGYYKSSIVFNGAHGTLDGNSVCVNGKFLNCGEVNGTVEGSGVVVDNNSRNPLVTQNTEQDRHQAITAEPTEYEISLSPWDYQIHNHDQL